MHKRYKISAIFVLLASLMTTSGLSYAQTGDDQAEAQNTSQLESSATPVDAPGTLAALQKRLDNLKQQVSTTKNGNKLSGLSDDANKLSGDADQLATSLQPLRAQVQSKLDVLGPVPEVATGALPETPQVIQQRKNLNAAKSLLDSQILQAGTIKTSASNLATQISGLRRDALRTQIALNTGSILSANFWTPLFAPKDSDQQRFSQYGEELKDAWHGAWQPEFRYGSAGLLVLALFIGVFGRRLLYLGLAWVTPRWLPLGRLRRSFFAAGTTAISVLTWGFSVKFFTMIFTRTDDVGEWVLQSADKLVGLVLFSALVVGLGRALLSTEHPSWRLPNLADPVAKALVPLPRNLAGCILLFGIIENLNEILGTSVTVTLFGNGLSALLVSLCSLVAPLRVNRVRRKLLAKGEQPEERSTLAGLMNLAVSGTAIAILAASLIGYVPLARFLSYELLWIGLVLSCLYMFVSLVTDLCESIFSTNTTTGSLLQSGLNLNERHLSLAATLLSAVGKTLLVLVAVVAIFNGTFGSTTPLQVINQAIEFWGDKGLEKVNIIPGQAVSALLFLCVGWYVLRSARRWLDNDFLPKTNMDRGMRASLVTLFTNVGYVLICLLTLSTLGIEWNKLAWIVSALSVGIGFGLQEIVKNFISGLILLTERPVKVGDLVTISGVEGDIRRINVRATEIQLSDRSTVIVPNSQFISQNVRNATMGNAQGVATIALTFPLDIDPEAVRNLLLDAYKQHESILETPAPSVSFKELSPDGIVLSVTGYVNSPRLVSSTKSALLYEILKRLRNEGISLARKQTMVVEQPSKDDE
ncbi:DUF3772 domain-containing protein [Rouxiella sp. Mn2063]|uniref:DUF3772 domain-containing protein n=1 Tax=Rouxiella sp. Mn2063 TaxID=3395262 RepID=UPI003BBA49FD